MVSPRSLNSTKIEKKGLRNINSKLIACMQDQISGYYKQALDDFEIVCYDSIIYAP